jgi:hypothetical protein
MRDGDFLFRTAGPEDEAGLRHLLATTPMPGSLTVTFEREPDYFLGCTVMGHVCDVIVAIHEPSGDLAGVLCRALRPLFVNGSERLVGNIGQVRIADRYRGHDLLRRGLPLFREMSDVGVLHTGVIAAGNARALRALVERGFPGVPEVAAGPGITTLGIILRRPKKPLIGDGLSVEHGAGGRLEEIIVFLRRNGGRRQFFPAYRVEDFADGVTERGFSPNDFFVARRRGEIVGVMGLWDQSGYKQTVVSSYGRFMRMVRSPYGLVASMMGAHPLPGPGGKIESAYASFTCIPDDDAGVMAGLLRAVYNDAARRGFHHLMIGLGTDDPLLAVARRYASIAYHSRVFFGGLADGFPQVHLDGRPAGVEIATL